MALWPWEMGEKDINLFRVSILLRIDETYEEESVDSIKTVKRPYPVIKILQILAIQGPIELTRDNDVYGHIARYPLYRARRIDRHYSQRLFCFLLMLACEEARR